MGGHRIRPDIHGYRLYCSVRDTPEKGVSLAHSLGAELHTAPRWAHCSSCTPLRARQMARRVGHRWQGSEMSSQLSGVQVQSFSSAIHPFCRLTDSQVALFFRAEECRIALPGSAKLPCSCTRKNTPNPDAVSNAWRHPDTLGPPSQMTIPEPVGVTRPRHFPMPWATGMAYLASGIWIAAVRSFDPGSSRLERRYARIWLDGYLEILVFAFVRGVP